MPQPADVIVKGAPLAAPVPPVTVPQLIRDAARGRAEVVAVVDAISGRCLSYGQLDHQVGRFAAALAAQGFAPGDTLLMFAPNCPEWPVAALGALAAGGVVSGANPGYAAADLAHQLRDAGATVVVTVPALVPTVREAAGLAGGGARIVVFGEAEGALGWAQMLACTDAEPAAPADPDALAALPYSSGTTGLPKGVMLTHRSLVANICQVRQVLDTPEGSAVLAFLPMFHIYGFTVVSLCALASGATLVTLPRFEPESFLRAIATYRVSRLAVVPPVMQFLASHPMVDQFDLSSLERVACGAAPLGDAIEQRVRARLKCTVSQGFGMTESAGCLAASIPTAVRSGACGQLLPGTEARVVDPVTGDDAARGEPGELWFRGPQVFHGYLHQAEATAATITPDGWMRSGDIGHIDADGYLTITDRLKELIKVKGYQVAPAELEALLLVHPRVADAAVIGRADERAGELPVAYVVARGALDLAELKAWVAQRVLAYKQLGDVVLCEAIPKTPAGKILRRVLRVRDAQRGSKAVVDG